MNSRRALAITRWLLATGALAGIVLVYKRWLHVNTTTVALTLLLLVLVIATQMGLRHAVVVSVFAAACYNFFFLPPLGTFTIAETQNWIALLAFLTTSILASRLAQKARNEAMDARRRQRELEILFRLSREMLQFESVSLLVSSLPASVAATTGATFCLLFLAEGRKLYQAGEGMASDVEIPHYEQLASALASAQANGDEIVIPLRSGVKPMGVLLLRGTTLSMETASAAGGLISVAIDRAHALENVARGEAVKESEHLRTLMIDSITHELRTPLTAIKGASTALLHREVSPDVNRELLTVIDEESDRLNRLVSEAVEMSQLDSHQVQMHVRELRLASEVERVLTSCGRVRETHTVRVQVPGDLTIRADEALLEKVLCNLLENAAKYSAPGTMITITGERGRDKTVVSVADQGIGIDGAEQALIFERFYRGRSQSSGVPGTGMGLAISRAIVEAHGGEIGVTSQVGRGSVFAITLPAA